MSIKVITPGLSTSVQDLGRPGYYHLGIPLSGGMDRYALRVSNLLVGNDEGAAVLETAFMGPELLFNRDVIVAVTGAGMLPKVDGEAKSTWSSFVIKAGQTLSFDFLTSGARAYIAVSGGIDVPIILGSRSTYTLGALGGFEGRGLAAQDELPINECDISKHTEKSIDESLRNLPEKPGALRFIPGIYWHRITEKSQASFINDTWKVAPEADRIGYRFKGGEALDFVDREQAFGAGSDPSNIVDSCYPYGSIQVPSGSEPIVLHRDAVSGGGYFMVGVVISADMDLIGQLQPNKPSTFVPVTMEEALIARRERKEKLSKVRDFLS